MLTRFESVLRQIGDAVLADLVNDALSGSADACEAFLVSDTLRGGAGSIADQAGQDTNREKRRVVEAALIVLGQQQIQVGKVNARTAMWVDAFMQWHRDGI